MPRERRPTSAEDALRAAVDAASGDSVMIPKEIAEEALEWRDRLVTIAEQRDRLWEKNDEWHRTWKVAAERLAGIIKTKMRFEQGEIKIKDLLGELGWKREKSPNAILSDGDILTAYWMLTTDETQPGGVRYLGTPYGDKHLVLDATQRGGWDALTIIAEFYGYSDESSARGALYRARENLRKRGARTEYERLLCEVRLPPDSPPSDR